MELDRAYTEERTGYHRKRGYGLESAGTTEEREAQTDVEEISPQRGITRRKEVE